MTLAAAVAPLAAYAIVFQTALYISLPPRLRMSIAPIVTGLIGAGLALGAGLVFGFDAMGIREEEPITALGWGLATVVVVAVVGLGMIGRGQLRSRLADQRLASLSRRRALLQILVRIPVVTALIEEAFFRGVLHAALTTLYPVGLAVWLGAGLFGLWHVGPGVAQAIAVAKSPRDSAFHTVGTVIVTTLAGAFLIWLRIETGSIWAPFAVHAAVNMTLAVFARFAARQPVPA